MDINLFVIGISFIERIIVFLVFYKVPRESQGKIYLAIPGRVITVGKTLFDIVPNPS